MKVHLLKMVAALMFLCPSIHSAQENKNPDKKGIKIGNIVEMSGNWFIAYRDGVAQTQADQIAPTINNHESAFVLKRSYITLKKKLDHVFSVRYTMDLTIDRDGEDAGNIETRLKYLYIKAKPRINSKVFTGLWIQAGMVHTPWLDYEQKINTYRVQDNMFIERNKIFNSADFGITVNGNIGPKMDADFLKKVKSPLTGKYLSYAFGLYNGGGYSGAEKNNNKLIAARLSLRPLPTKIPELQISAYFNTGKGNSEESPDFNQALGFVAYTGKQLTLTAQRHKGIGDFRATYTKDTNPKIALKNSGYSFFGEYKIKKSPFAIWGRHDYFKVKDIIDDTTKRYIGGLTYKINNYLRMVLNVEHSEKINGKNDIYEVNLEVSF